MPRPRLALWTIAAAALLAGPARAQLTLDQALREADRAAFANRAAAGATTAARGQSLAPLAGILPSVRVEAGYVRTTDPIGVFGSTLRQRTVSEANFDPQRLNHPAALGNHQGGIVLEQPLFNADAWTGRAAADGAAEAARATEEWTRLTIRADVVRAYYGTVLARERVTTLRGASRAAHAHVSQVESMVRQGLVTKSDALLASVRAGEIDAQLAEAEGGALSAARQLAVLLGRDGSEPRSALAGSASLPAADRIRSVVAADTADLSPEVRADVRAATEGLDAARADARRARVTRLPRVNSFARLDWNSADGPYAGDGNWTVGVMASWSLFAGGRELADVQAAAGRASAAKAGAEGAQARARMEIQDTRTALAVALTRLTIAERAATQSAEAHRIVGRKYAGGLASVVELLDAQAVEMQSALASSQARWSVITAAADRRRALGRDPGSLAVLEESGAIASGQTRPTPR